MSEWQPIKTAPKDRTIIVLGAYYPKTDIWGDPWACWWGPGAGEWMRWPHKHPPTHWMPLPEPPEAQP
jgi:hypothetical protein